MITVFDERNEHNQKLGTVTLFGAVRSYVVAPFDPDNF